MSKLMTVLGILLLAAGTAFAIMGLINQAPLLARGIDMSSAINLIIGGVLAIGLGGVIGALGPGAVSSAASAIEEEAHLAPEPSPPAAEEAASAKVSRFPSFARRMDETTTTAATTLAKAEEVVTPAVKETITALEQAKTDLEAALGGTGTPAATAEGELYVVEDKVVRGHAARILSDGTVEAETDEGWMRFENLEHLDEYLDAVEQA